MFDIRLALRVMRRQPGFTLVSITLIALAIGATTSIFSVVSTVVLEPLPSVKVPGASWRQLQVPVELGVAAGRAAFVRAHPRDEEAAFLQRQEVVGDVRERAARREQEAFPGRSSTRRYVLAVGLQLVPGC